MSVSNGPMTRGFLYGYISAARRRPRIFVCAALAVLVYFLIPSSIREATRALIAWNVGAWAFIVIIFIMMAQRPEGSIRLHAAQEDERPGALLLIAIIAALAALAAIVWELGPVKEMAGAVKAGHLVLVGATILSAWTFIHLMFALHYAGHYYAAAGDADGICGGLAFPGTNAPGWREFMYESFVIGCACATADVNATTSEMRAICLVQGVVAFFFNTIILALTINIGAGLI